MQRDFYERVVQTLRECNVISTNSGANGVGGVRANYFVRAYFGTVSGSENSVCTCFFPPFCV